MRTSSKGMWRKWLLSACLSVWVLPGCGAADVVKDTAESICDVVEKTALQTAKVRAAVIRYCGGDFPTCGIPDVVIEGLSVIGVRVSQLHEMCFN